MKSIAKIMLLSFSLWLIAQWFFIDMLSLSHQPLLKALPMGLSFLMQAISVLIGALVLVCIIDVPYQKWSNIRKLRMTHKELRDETKESEGQPEVRARLREKQQEMANRRMMQAIPQADVIITNPTHFAVAIRYDQNTAKAPYLVAKGVDRTALRICAVARDYNKPIVQSPALARVVYHTTQLNQEIPDELYVATAKVLAYVHHLNDFKAGRVAREPEVPQPEINRVFQDRWDKKPS